MQLLALTFRSLGAVLAGYATIVVGALLFQDLLFGGLSHASPPRDLIVGGGMTAVFAALGGYVSYALAPRRPAAHAGTLIGWLCIETTLLTAEGANPLWFDALAGMSVIAGAAVGAYACARRSRRTEENRPAITGAPT